MRVEEKVVVVVVVVVKVVVVVVVAAAAVVVVRRRTNLGIQIQKSNGHVRRSTHTHTQRSWATENDSPLYAHTVCPYPFFEATPPGAAPG